MKTLSCPICLSGESLREIIWGLPMDQPDPNIYVCGGCCITENMPDLRCVKCEWEGSNIEAEKAARLHRFIWTDEDRG